METRKTHSLDDLFLDVAVALRGLRRSPGFAAVALLTLALGVGSTTAIWSLVDGVLLSPMPYPESERLVQVWDSTPAQGLEHNNVSLPNFVDWRQRATSFEAMAASMRDRQTLTGLGEPRRLTGTRVTEDFFRVAGTPAHLGRVLAADDFNGADDAFVLGYGLWQRLFAGDRGVIGQKVEVDGEAVTVVGVMPPGFDFPFGEETWRPLVLDPDAGRNSHRYDVHGRLRPGVTLATARTELETVAAALAETYPDSNTGHGVAVEPLREARVGESRSLLLLLLLSVGLLLSIACANVAHLVLGRCAGRDQEMALRAALGAGRGRLVRQLLAESLVLALLGGAGGVLLAAGLLETFRTAMAAILPRAAEVRLDGGVLLFAWAVSLGCGFLFGLVPAFQTSRAAWSEALRGARTIASGSRRLRGGLAAAEVALALVLLLTAGLLVRSFLKVADVEPGFELDTVALRVDLPSSSYSDGPAQAAFFERLVASVEALPQVEAAGVVQRPPLRRGFMGSFQVAGQPVPPLNQEPLANFRLISPRYFDALGVRLLVGRPFLPTDSAAAPPVAVVNETFARRHFGGREPIGQVLEEVWGSEPRRVVGVVADMRTDGLLAEAPATIYMPQSQRPFGAMTLLVRTKAKTAPLLEAMAPVLRAKVWELDPNLAIDHVDTLRDRLASSLAERRMLLSVVGVFAAAALLLAGVGLYGVLAQLVTSRSREIALRMALGARQEQVMGLVLGRALALIAVGLALGAAGTLAASRLIGSLLHGVRVGDPATWTVAAIGLAALGLLASWVPARRAARIEAMQALRGD